MRKALAGLGTLLLVGLVATPMVAGGGGKPDKLGQKPGTAEALQAEIDGLKAAKVAWREIAWKSCLLEGLRESRAKNKPALLWVFIDRPIDDARC
jgi:hypothetical protein